MPVWEAMRLNQPGESIVVVPSVTPDATQARRRRAGARGAVPVPAAPAAPAAAAVIYVTGRPVPESIVEYYLGLLPGVIPRQARAPPAHGRDARRLGAPAGREAARAPARARADPRAHPGPRALPPRAVHDQRRCERDLALTLGIPLYGADPRLLAVRHEDRLPAAVRRGRRHAPARPRGPARRSTASSTRSPTMRAAQAGDAPSAIVKLNDGVAGRGNARRRPARPARRPARPTSAPSCAAASRRWRSSTRTSRSTATSPSSRSDGGIVEERVVGAELRSPSVQLRVTPLGEVELLSTHDQLLGGPSGQSYLGCRFPADFGYAQRDHAARRPRSARALAARGRARPLRRRLRRRARRPAARGRRTRSSSTCARAGRRTPSSRSSSSPTAATTRRRRCSPRRAAARSTSSPPTTSSRSSCAASRSTTSSTSRCATGCTSTRRARPASCST